MTDLSVDARLLAAERDPAPGIHRPAVAIATTLLAAGALALAQSFGWRQGARAVRLHVRVAGVHCRPARRGSARADADARRRRGVVLPGARRRDPVWRTRAWRDRRGRRLRARRRVPVRH